MNLCYNQIVTRSHSTSAPAGGRPGPPDAPGGDVQLTVDQLARLAGTTTRNVRAFQTAGLLRRPRLRGRTGLYGADHLDRLRAILRLQGAGFSLAAIGVLVRACEQGLTLEQVLGLPAAAGPGHRAPDTGADDLAAFDDWPALRAVDAVAVVPTTVLDLVAS
jgi:DNA-binding transcriptional MerR regulator